jgi:NAD(P)-dependent dehydrogenase (short-subunit alcohol dehydrogenase family)
MKLASKIAIVTGSSRGIGRAIALALAKEGADVVVNFVNESRAAEEVANDIRLLGQRSFAIKADVSKRVEIDQMVNRALDKFGRIDILVNNAGVATLRPVETLLEEEWDRDININLKGTFLCSQSVGRVMIKQKEGNIISVTSIAGKLGFTKHAAYCAAKAGIIALTKVLASEWAKHGIRVNAVAPGFIETDMTAEFIARGIRSKEEYEHIKKDTPMKRLGVPEEICGLIVFLASEESTFVTGETIFVDGGYSVYGHI